jgi:hypothetical protein
MGEDMNHINFLPVLCAAVCMLAAVDSFAQSPNCKIKRDPFVNNGTSNGTMTTVQGGACEFRFRFQNTSPPDSWKLVDAPKSGKVTFKDDVAEYQPNADFSGEDKFVIEVFGRVPSCSHLCNRNGRFQFSVAVQPKP